MKILEKEWKRASTTIPTRNMHFTVRIPRNAFPNGQQPSLDQMPLHLYAGYLAVGRE